MEGKKLIKKKGGGDTGGIPPREAQRAGLRIALSKTRAAALADASRQPKLRSMRRSPQKPRPPLLALFDPETLMNTRQSTSNRQ